MDVTYTIKIPAGTLETLETGIADLTAGQALLSPGNTVLSPVRIR